MTTFWISKYALSQGIYSVESDKIFEGTMLCVQPKDQLGYTAHYHGEGRDWHRTKDGAIARAEQMRVAKIAALKKQIAKLESTSFG
jgi:hypothetical protein